MSGYVNDFVDDGKFTITMEIFTASCVKDEANKPKLKENTPANANLNSVSFTISNRTMDQNLCAQTVTMVFYPKGGMQDVLTVEFETAGNIMR